MRKFNKDEGRSITEMLGVLALIGILSIGALTGYRLGMNKLKANELIQEMEVRLVAIYQELAKNPQNVTMEMGNLTRQGFRIDSSLDEADDSIFYMTVYQLPTAVCKEVMKLNWEYPLQVFINGYQVQNGHIDSCGTNENVETLSFEFDKNGVLALDSGDRPEVSDMPETTYPEPETTIPDCSDASMLMDVNRNCFSCTTSAGVDVTGIEENCKICPNRVLGGYGNHYCVLPCPSTRPIMSTDGKCYACAEKAVIDVYGVTQTCSLCSNRVMAAYVGGDHYCALKCDKDNQLMDYYGECHECGIKKDVYVAEAFKNCDVCPERHVSGNYCVLN